MKHWTIIEGRLTRELQMADFTSCISLVNEIAELAETMNHHPDMMIYSYNHLRIALFTHSENMLTDLDYLLADKIENLISR